MVVFLLVQRGKTAHSGGYGSRSPRLVTLGRAGVDGGARDE